MQFPEAISVQAGHTPQGSPGLPAWQFKAFARIRAVDVLPLPRGPENRKA